MRFKFFAEKVLYLFRKLHKLFLDFCGVEIHFHRQDRAESNAVFTCNHMSAFEVTALYYKFELYPIAWNLLEKFFIIGRLMTVSGFIFVELEKKEKSYKISRQKSKEDLVKRIDEGKNILIFPEGHCHEKLGPFYVGAFDISIRTNRPIVPVYSFWDSGEKEMIWGNFGFLEHVKKVMGARNKILHVYFLKPIYPQDFKNAIQLKKYTEEKYRELQEKVSAANISDRANCLE